MQYTMRCEISGLGENPHTRCYYIVERHNRNLKSKWVLLESVSTSDQYHTICTGYLERRLIGIYMHENEIVLSPKGSSNRASVTVLFPSLHEICWGRGPRSPERLRVTIFQIDLGLPATPPMTREELAHPPVKFVSYRLPDENTRRYSSSLEWECLLFSWQIGC